MLIRSKLIRTGGSEITLGKGKDDRRLYHFKPRDPRKPDEDHVCDVNDQKDIATFLAIEEGYEIHPSEVASRVKEDEDAPSPKPKKPTTLRESTAAGQDGDASKAKPALTRAQLFDAVAKKTGKRPHATTSTAKLQAILDATE